MQEKFRFNQNIATSPCIPIVSDGGSIKKAKRSFFEISCKASGFPINHDSPKTSIWQRGKLSKPHNKLSRPCDKDRCG